MFKFINYFKDDVAKTSLVAIVAIGLISGVIFIVGNTFAYDSYTIVFNRAEGTEVMKTCTTNAEGKLDEECITTISDICNRWSLNSLYNGQTNQIYSSQFASMTFTQDTNYYCVGGSSGIYNMGCYVCKTDSSIMHYSSSGDANEACPAGYTKSTTITKEEDCKVEACYVCDSDKSIMKWDNSGISDNNCTAGYTKDSSITSASECEPVIPDVCYVCNSNENIMKWDNSGTGDSNCSSGYTELPNTPQSQCVSKSCYVCNDDENIMKWDNNGTGDNNCSSGYTAVDTPQSQCATIENPPTGDELIGLVWIIGIVALGYVVYYFRIAKNEA